MRICSCLACHPSPAQPRPAPASAVAQLPGVSASARHERCTPPLRSTIAPVIGPWPCRCTAYRLSVDPNFFKKSRGRFFLLKGPSAVSILFPRYPLKRKQIFALTLHFPNSCSASLSCASSLSIQSVVFARQFTDVSPKTPSHLTDPFPPTCLPCSQSPSSGLRSLQETFWSPSASLSLPL